MTALQHWTPEQWSVFTVVIAAGVIAMAVLAVLHRARWTPQPLRRVAPTSAPRPSLVLTERRTPSFAFDPSMRLDDTIALGQIARDEWVDPMAADFTDPGIGALASIQALGDTDEMQTTAELDAWINAYADLRFAMPETAAAREQMRINLEPAMRTARLWRMRGEGGAGRRALNDWRMDTKTGEYPMITTSDLHPYVAALLVS